MVGSLGIKLKLVTYMKLKLVTYIATDCFLQFENC